MKYTPEEESIIKAKTSDLIARLSDLPTEDQAERLLRELALQLNRLNDHLAQIAGELHHIHEDGLAVRTYSDDIKYRKDRP